MIVPQGEAPDLFRCDADGCDAEAPARVARDGRGFVRFAWAPAGWETSDDDAPPIHLCPLHAGLLQSWEMAG